MPRSRPTPDATIKKKSAFAAPSVVRFYVISTSLFWKWSTTLELRLLLTSPPLCTFISFVSIANFVYCFFVAEVNVRALSSQLASP